MKNPISLPIFISRISFLSISFAVSVLFFITGCNFKSSQNAKDTNLSFENINTSTNEIEKIKQNIYVCTDYLNNILKIPPPPLIKIQVYGTRTKFIDGLIQSGRSTSRNAKLFEHSGAPKPLNGVLMIVTDTTPRKICHEIVHMYLDHYAKLHSSFNNSRFWATWFDEGSAEYFSSRAFGDKDLKKAYFIIGRDIEPISFNELNTTAQWMNLYAELDTKRKIYSQSHLMIKYLISEYGLETYLDLYKISQVTTFDKHFRKIFHSTPDEFFKKKKTQMILDSDSCCSNDKTSKSFRY